MLHGLSSTSRLVKLQQLAGAAGTRAGKTRVGRFVLDSVHAVALVVRGFRGEKISLRASALTYITIFSLVPLLAVAFAIVRGLGQEGLRRAVHEFIFTNLAPGAREQIGAYLDQFIARASASAMGGLGGGLLLVSALSLLHNIERSLNEIWGVTRPRPLVQRALIYWMVLTLGPIALGFSLLATTAMRTYAIGWHIPHSALALMPLASTVMLLSFLYVVAPNARVQLRAAFAGGLIAGTGWELAKHGYALYAAKAISYSAIYGSLGAIPLFLLWVYVSWLIVLFGARLAFALQHAAGGIAHPRLEDPRTREILCARVAVQAAADFLSSAVPPSPRKIARVLGLEPAQVADAAAALKKAGLIAELPNGGLVPAKPPAQIQLLDIARAARGTLFRWVGELPSTEAATRALGDLFKEADLAGKQALERIDLAALARPLADARTERKGNPAS